jgi:hypothetical protein
MPCVSKARTPTEREAQITALAKLQRALEVGNVSVVIGQSGGIAFRGWQDAERAGLTDLCAYRKLRAANSPELRRAIARAEGIYGRKVDQRAIVAGVHSHDGGATWGTH